MTSASTEAIPPIHFLWGTAFLMAVNVGFFIALLMQQDAVTWTADLGVLLRFGAKQNGLIAQGDFWRIFMPLFLSANILQMVFNIIFLSYAAYIIEISNNAAILLFVYFFSGICGTLASASCIPSISQSTLLQPQLATTSSSAAILGLVTFVLTQSYFNFKHFRFPLSVKFITSHTAIISGFFALPFLVPYLDLIALLAAGLSGILLGFGTSCQQLWSYRRECALPYLHSGVYPTPPYYAREGFWFIVLGIFMGTSSIGIAFLPRYENTIANGIEFFLNKTIYNRPMSEFSAVQKYLSSDSIILNPHELIENINLFDQENQKICVLSLQNLLDDLKKEGVFRGNLSQKSNAFAHIHQTQRLARLEALASMTESLGFSNISFPFWACVSSIQPSARNITELIVTGLNAKKYNDLKENILPKLLLSQH